MKGVIVAVSGLVISLTLVNEVLQCLILLISLASGVIGFIRIWRASKKPLALPDKKETVYPNLPLYCNHSKTATKYDEHGWAVYRLCELCGERFGIT